MATEAAYVTVTRGWAAPVAGQLPKVLVGHCYLRPTFPVCGACPKEGYF